VATCNFANPGGNTATVMDAVRVTYTVSVPDDCSGLAAL
jgi:hypothetical protein